MATKKMSEKKAAAPTATDSGIKPAKKSVAKRNAAATAELTLTAPNHQEIQLSAYYLWVQRGRQHGNDAQDWLGLRSGCKGVRELFLQNFHVKNASIDGFSTSSQHYDRRCMTTEVRQFQSSDLSPEAVTLCSPLRNEYLNLLVRSHGLIVSTVHKIRYQT